REAKPTGDGMRASSARVFWELSSADDAIVAARELHGLGFRSVEAYTPYEVPELEPLLAIQRTRIPVLAFLAAAFGTLLAYAIIWYCNAYSYPLDVGGRPYDSLPADVPIMFETAILFASLAIFVATLVRSGLPRLHSPVFEIPGFERVSIDAYWIGVDDTELGAEAFERALTVLGRENVKRAVSA
ncbi:MAG: DUF3341 domain-containing protein, partial [Polyangiaceae bacterium]